ncbi:N-acetylglucosaminidase [Staphylococcus gallinarum]|jgi:beta-N-acetylglucosaminidase|uniref:Autolysin n=7 Tax=Staphylococcus gallinarum TaxID=1293 RepID=A0A0D0SMT9_STAGA|nr:N-acetylglucosaminidase [Staphylococcus gallinarum]KIR11563.1 autolysin [Staphylococcus gallinarum]MCD8786882.1 N-acetylglucosaminidase [Staphylococcus gallinarum]MCD8819843.1 N-acetylglucosaminidase [Staphylococcus gallinarum]MCD8826174.1 N-acetylglucosaminidase [Staphylococcus gallinarum]MCD8827883.1 N-acetylglucosaminidase [Staphylococcus gallinarum]
MTKHKKGSLLSIIGLLVVLGVAAVIVFSMISDQIFFKSVNKQESVENLKVTLDKAAKKQIDNYTSQQVSSKDNKTWRDASSTEIKDAMDSNKFIDSDTQKYQFLELDRYQGIDKNRIKRMLFDNPTLLKHTDAFINAAKEKHVNEVYLISHALLETGSAKSELASGVEIDGKKYYNFFGVGALDEDPIKTGSEYAKKHGWDTPEKAISGGADFIHSHFLSNKDQNTLYSMRWNPKNPGEHQYATDIKWAESNASIMANFYKDMKTEGKYFKYFVYKDDEKHRK